MNKKIFIILLFPVLLFPGLACAVNIPPEALSLKCGDRQVLEYRNTNCQLNEGDDLLNFKYKSNYINDPNTKCQPVYNGTEPFKNQSYSFTVSPRCQGYIRADFIGSVGYQYGGDGDTIRVRIEDANGGLGGYTYVSSKYIGSCLAGTDPIIMPDQWIWVKNVEYPPTTAGLYNVTYTHTSINTSVYYNPYGVLIATYPPSTGGLGAFAGFQKKSSGEFFTPFCIDNNSCCPLGLDGDDCRTQAGVMEEINPATSERETTVYMCDTAPLSDTYGKCIVQKSCGVLDCIRDTDCAIYEAREKGLAIANNATHISRCIDGNTTLQQYDWFCDPVTASCKKRNIVDEECNSLTEDLTSPTRCVPGADIVKCPTGWKAGDACVCPGVNMETIFSTCGPAGTCAGCVAQQGTFVVRRAEKKMCELDDTYPQMADVCNKKIVDKPLDLCYGWFRNTCTADGKDTEDHSEKCYAGAEKHIAGYTGTGASATPIMGALFAPTRTPGSYTYCATDAKAVIKQCGCSPGGTACISSSSQCNGMCDNLCSVQNGVTTEFSAQCKQGCVNKCTSSSSVNARAATFELCSTCVPDSGKPKLDAHGILRPTADCKGVIPQITGSVDCGTPQTSCVPGALFDYCITIGGCRSFGPFAPRCPYFDIQPCMSCGNHCNPGESAPCANGGTKVCSSTGQWGPCQGPCAPEGATATCETNGTQTCESGQWGPCVKPCPVGTRPHYACSNGACVSVNDCGISNCQNCGCIPGQTRPCVCGGRQICQPDGTWSDCPAMHTDCVAGYCKCVNGTGQNVCSVINAQCCPPGQTKPHSECNSSNVCTVQNTCGITDCSACPCGGSPPTCSCGGQPQCINGAWVCPSNHTECINGSCQCANGSGTDQCALVGAPCTPGGGGCGTASACTPGSTKSCPCGGSQTCQADCTWTQCPGQHTDCLSGICKCVTGSGTNACSVVGSPCNGSCGTGGCTPGASLACPCGGSQTCQADCTWTQCPGKHTDCNAGTGFRCACADGQGNNKCTTIGLGCGNCIPGESLACPCGGSQVCKEDGTWSDCPDNHTACINGICQCVDGAGKNECNTVGAPCNCLPGQILACPCGGIQTCLPDGSWTPCDDKHTECVDGICKCIDGAGFNKCTTVGAPCGCIQGQVLDCPCGGTQTCLPDGTWTECPDKHTQCHPITGICVCVDGSGQNECSPVGSRCACENGDKLPCPCGGEQECVNGVWTSCPDNHTACIDGICQCVQGSGINTCQVVGAECPCENGDKKQCFCGGEQECINGVWSDCPDKHTECVDGKCRCVDGAGQNGCQIIGADCPCENGETRPCPCGGVQECINGAWSDCPDEHLECVDNVCTCVTGDGINTCFVKGALCDCGPEDEFPCPCGGERTCVDGIWSDCPDEHLECVDNICTCVTGDGIDECFVKGALCDNNSPPTASQIKVASNYCAYAVSGIPLSGLASFSWLYGDAEGDLQTKWQMQISTSASSETEFSKNMIFDSQIVSGSANKVNLPVLPVSTNPTSYCKGTLPGRCNFINYGVQYFFRVKVWEAVTGKNSGWIYYGPSGAGCNNNGSLPSGCNGTSVSSQAIYFKYPYSHPGPTVSFVLPESAAPGTSLLFIDTSTCYNDDGSSYVCSTLAPETCSAAPDYNGDGVKDCYGWWFTNFKTRYPYNPDDRTLGSSNHVYPNPGTNSLGLRICDDLGCCALPQNLKIGTSSAGTIPKWQEVTPF